MEGIFFVLNLLDDCSVENIHQLIGGVLVHLTVVFSSEVDYSAVLDIGVENAVVNGPLDEHGQVGVVLQVGIFSCLYRIFKSLEQFFSIFVHVVFLQSSRFFTVFEIEWSFICIVA